MTLIWESLPYKQVFSIRCLWGTIFLFLSWHASIVLTVIKTTVKSLAIIRPSSVMSVLVCPISMSQCSCRFACGKSSSHRVLSLSIKEQLYRAGILCLSANEFSSKSDLEVMTDNALAMYEIDCRLRFVIQIIWVVHKNYELTISCQKLRYTFKKLILSKELFLFSYQVSSCRMKFLNDKSL